MTEQGQRLWATGTNGTGADHMAMQLDGNFVIYKGGSAKWASGTNGHGGTYLKMQNDGNLVMYKLVNFKI